MKSIDIPSKFSIPFANDAGVGYIRPIPTNSQIGITDGAASLHDGFPPLNFLPIGAGGVPPFGQDFNGLLKQSTSWDRWMSAGAPIKYDSVFQAQIGGYPVGTVVQSAVTLGIFWFSIVDDNVTNPDTGGLGWINLATLFAQNHTIYGLFATPATTFNVPSATGTGTVITSFGSVTNLLKNSTFSSGVLTIGAGDDGWWLCSTWLGTNLVLPGSGGTASSYGWTSAINLSTDGGGSYISKAGVATISSSVATNGPYSGSGIPLLLAVGDKVRCSLAQNSGITQNAPCGLSVTFLGKTS